MPTRKDPEIAARFRVIFAGKWFLLREKEVIIIVFYHAAQREHAETPPFW